MSIASARRQYEPKRDSSISSRNDRGDRSSYRGGGGPGGGGGAGGTIGGGPNEVRSNNSNEHDDGSSNEKTGSSNGAGEDDWRIRAWEVFTTIADRGHVMAEGMTAFANEMNVECELRHVVRAVRQEGFEGSINFDQATRLLEVIPVMLYDEGSESEQNEERHVLKMLPWEYLMHKLKPEADRRRIEEEKVVRLVYCGCTPQQWMLMATGFIFLTVVGIILGLMMGLWVASDQQMYESTLDVSARIASEYVSIAADVSRDGLKDALTDLVHFLTHAIEADTYTQLDIMRQNGYNRVVIDFPVVQSTVNATIDGRVAELQGRITAIKDLLSEVTVLDDTMARSIVTAMHGWNLDSGYEYFFVDANDMTKIIGATATYDTFRVSSCFAPLQAGKSGFIESGRGTNGGADARIAYMTSPTSKLCVSLSKAKLLRFARIAATELINDANNATFSSNDTPRMPSMETVLAYKDEALNNGRITVRTNKKYSTMLCDLFSGDGGGYDPKDSADVREKKQMCASFENLLEQCRATKCQWQNYSTYYYNGETFIVSMTYDPLSDAVIASGQSIDWAIQIARSGYIDGITIINAMDIIPLDVSFATITRNSVLIPQMNPPLYACPTASECRWLPSAVATIRAAFNTNEAEVTVGHNYVFDPVITGAKSLFFNDTVVVQSNLERNQLLLSAAIGAGLDAANLRLPDGLEVQLYRHKKSAFLRTFDAKGQCPQGATCERDPALGIVELSTCEGCRRGYDGAHSTSDVTFITQLECDGFSASANAAGGACDESDPKVDMGLFSSAAHAFGTDEVTIDSGHDYKGNSVMAAITYMTAVDAVVGIFADKSVLHEYRTRTFTIFCVVIILCVLASVAALVLFTRQTLKKVENEWFVYKASIEGEKQKFNTMFQEIVPPRVLVKYHRGQKIIAEQHSILSIAFVDVCAFAERQKAMSAKEVVRTIAYHFELYATIAARFKLFRLKTFGDSTCVVGGIGTKEPASAVAFSVASFAGYVAQLLSPLFSHYPQLLPKLAEAYKNDPNPERPRHVFQTRIGLHAGAATSSMVDYGRTPSFDILGPSLSLARRMQVTAAPGRINCSTAFKEQLEMGDFAGQFEFDTLKKLVAKGQGTVSTYPIRSMSLTIDEIVLQRLHIQYANGMFDFRPLAAQCKGASKSAGSSSAPSNRTGDSASIHDSMMASTNPPGPDERHY